MPIYAYKCATCGFAKDVLQKISDTPLSVCPSCGQETFSKQVTAAGFQLKGSGWYVTDFRDGNKGGASSKPATGDGAASSSEGAAAKPADAPAAAAPAPAPAAAPAPSAPPATKAD